MLVDNCMFMTDCVSKFYGTVYVSGWFHHPSEQLQSVTLRDPNIVHQLSEVRLDHKGVEETLGANRGFRVQALRNIDDTIDPIEIEFVTDSGRRLVRTLKSLAVDRMSRYATPQLFSDFLTRMRTVDSTRKDILDVGGRDRSRVDRRGDYPGHSVTVLDIAPGSNVDVVGDAHRLSTYFPRGHFDAVVSVSVFEHLAMPWKAAIEINRVLKPGGLVFVHTHQTLGMHDIPWDFWRFSDTAWDALFNAKTGFEILGRALDGESFIVPHIYRDNKRHAERSAGFEGSSVMARKIGEAEVDWPVTLDAILSTSYPLTDDGSTGRDLF